MAKPCPKKKTHTHTNQFIRTHVILQEPQVFKNQHLGQDPATIEATGTVGGCWQLLVFDSSRSQIQHIPPSEGQSDSGKRSNNDLNKRAKHYPNHYQNQKHQKHIQNTIKINLQAAKISTKISFTTPPRNVFFFLDSDPSLLPTIISDQRLLNMFNEQILGFA